MGTLLKNLDSQWSVGPLTMRGRYHYAWVVVVFMSAMQMAAGSIRNTFGVLVDPMVEKFDWGQGELSGAYAISSVMSAFFAPVAGWMADRFGERKTLLLGVACFGGGMTVAGATSQLWHLYIAYGVLLGTALAIFQVVLVTTAMSWFRKRLGIAVGILMALNGLGPAIGAPLMTYLLEVTTWQKAFWITGFFGTGVMLSLLLFFRNKPSDLGLLPYGATPEEERVRGAESIDRATFETRTRLFRHQVRRTNAFWNLIAIHFLGCVGHVIVIIYVVSMATHQGISSAAAAGIITVLSLASLISRFAAPVIADRLGGKVSMSICFLIQGVTVIALFWASDLWAFYAFAALFGLGLGGEMSVFPVINRQYYGVAPMGNIYGWQMLGGGSGMALGGWLGGVIFDLTGSYDVAIWLSMICSLSGAVLVLLLEPTKRMLVRPWYEMAQPPPSGNGAAASVSVPAGRPDR